MNIMDARTYYERETKRIIKENRKYAGVSYKELALRLEAYGVHVDSQVLINRINKGKFSFTFALQVLAALGVDDIYIPTYPPTEKELRMLRD